MKPDAVQAGNYRKQLSIKGECMTPRQMVDHCLKLDIHRLNREGHLSPNRQFEWVWPGKEDQPEATIKIYVFEKGLTLCYSILLKNHRQAIKEFLPFMWSTCKGYWHGSMIFYFILSLSPPARLIVPKIQYPRPIPRNPMSMRDSIQEYPRLRTTLRNTRNLSPLVNGSCRKTWL